MRCLIQVTVIRTAWDSGHLSSAGAVVGATREAHSSWLTYETFYGLRERPFALTSDVKFYYQSRSHAAAFDDLLAGIRRRESLSVLTGDIGTGKTTLCRTVLHSLDRKTFSSFVPDPFTSREDLLKVVLMDFGVVSVDDLTSGRLKGASRTELSYLLYQFLDSLGPLQAFAVVVIDEAQNLALSLLEEIRILSDADGRERQLQIVLVGQLELREKLKLPEMRQVDHRISVRGALEPLSREGVAGYIAHRLQVAGGSPDRIKFSDEALDIVFGLSGGLPRLVNRICDRALYAGHLRRADIIDQAILKSVIGEFVEGHADATPNVASARTSDAGATSAAPEEPSEGVDQWLMAVKVDTTSGATADSLVSRSTCSDQTAYPNWKALPADVRGERNGSLPLTHMQRIIRRWSRKVAVAAFWAAVGVIGVVSCELGWHALIATEEPMIVPLLPPHPSLPVPLAITPPAPPNPY